MSTRTVTYTTSSSSTGVPSKVIALLAALFAILWSVLDVNFHGHFSCATQKRMVEKLIKSRLHLRTYMADDRPVVNGKPVDKDFAGQTEAGTVECLCTGDRKIRLVGKVVSNSIKDELGDLATYAVGNNGVENQIESLNLPAIEAVKTLLEGAPTKIHMNYVVRDRGTIVLTGDLPNPEMKDRITDMVSKIRGVRSVVNDLGAELQVQRMLRIHNIWFDFNQWKIRPESQATLDEVANKIAEYLAQNPNGTVRVEGHTDSIATEQYNKWLSEKRANAVVDALAAHGIDTKRLKPVGMGESKLLAAPDDTPEKRAENRRIEFYFE